MARYSRDFDGERRTAILTVKLTPAERGTLAAGAKLQGAQVSAYARELLFERHITVVAGTKRNPEAAALMRALNAIGNNLNQISRHLNSTGELRAVDDLPAALDLHKQAIARVLDL
jgi:hypothetical protein